MSCRIKVPQSLPQPDSSRASGDKPKGLKEAAAHDNMDRPRGATSPRRQGNMAEALQNLNSNMETLELPTDPDAQATVTDFLDFTEYLPSDMIRSLTLIGKLDKTYIQASANVDELTKTYGNLPELPTDGRPDPVHLRRDISQNLNEAIRARTLSSAEAARMADNVDRHYNRAKNILVKLQAMAEAYPPSREPSPVPQKSKSPVVVRPPKITLRLDGARPAEETTGARVRKHRAPRITIPGEVLAPYELDYESFGSESDPSESDDEPITPRQTPAPPLVTHSNGRIKLKIQGVPKNKTPKPARIPRPPGVMGTNVHSAVAGISTSNALAMLKPPPPDAVKGSEDAPWLALTEWELGMLRKRMKKNAVWSPSDTMIARELKQLGRGIEAYRAAKNKADAAGQPMDQPVPPQLMGVTVAAEGAISVEAVRADQDLSLINRGMKLNEAKKLKKENQAKELAKAEEEAAESIRKIHEAAHAMKGLFEPTPRNGQKLDPKALAKKPSRTPTRKRKRDSEAEASTTEKSTEGEVTTVKAEKVERPLPKRSKTETPIPAPQPMAPKANKQATPASALGTPALESASSIASEAAPSASENVVDSLPANMPKTSPTKSGNAALENGKEIKKEVRRIEKQANTRARRSSAAAIAAALANETPTPAPEPLPAKRPTSSRSKAASVEPAHPLTSTATATATIDRPRRASTARNTPAPEPRQTNKRAKRPAPGVVTSGSEGSTAVSVGKRSAATRKKAGVKKDKKDGQEGSAAQETFDEYDDDGNLIDPDEPRYCLCNRVSFGTMIGCESADVSSHPLLNI